MPLVDVATASAPPTLAFEPAAELLKALAHPVRLAVVRALSDGPRCVHELVELAQVSQPLLSQHLRVLRAARLVRGTRRGKEIAYRLSDDHVAQIAADAVRHASEQAPAAPAAPGRLPTSLPKDT